MLKSSLYIRRITISAIFLSVALVLKTYFSVYIPLFGQNGMRVGISGIFSAMPSILFGPVYGALVSGLSDLLGFLLRPTGAYLPLMTLILAAGGFIRGALWMALRRGTGRGMRIWVAVFSFFFLLFGVLNFIYLNADGVNTHFYDTASPGNVNTERMHLISRMLIERTAGTKDPAGNLSAYLVTMTAGFAGTAAFGLILLCADILISKRFYREARKGVIMRLLLTMIISGLIVTTLNTVLLRETVFPAWKVMPFAVVWLPRVIEEVLSNTIYAYFVALLLGLIESQPWLRGLTDHTWNLKDTKRQKGLL